MAKIAEILNRYAELIVDEMRNNLLTAMRARASEVGGIQPHASTLAQEMLFKVIDNVIVIEIPQYGIYIEEGVKGAKKTYRESAKSPFQFKDKMPPTSVFSGKFGWISQRGLIDKAKLRKKHKTKKQLREAVINENKRLAFAIAKSIRDKGIKGYHFIQQTLNSNIIDAMVSELADNTSKEIIAIIDLK